MTAERVGGVEKGCANVRPSSCDWPTPGEDNPTGIGIPLLPGSPSDLGVESRTDLLHFFPSSTPLRSFCGPFLDGGKSQKQELSKDKVNQTKEEEEAGGN